MRHHKWDEHTLTLVRTLWGLLIATIIIAGSLFFVVPHLMEDGFSRDDIGFVVVLVVLAFVMALPTVFMEALGGAVEAVKAWKGKGGDS